MCNEAGADRLLLTKGLRAAQPASRRQGTSPADTLRTTRRAHFHDAGPLFQFELVGWLSRTAAIDRDQSIETMSGQRDKGPKAAANSALLLAKVPLKNEVVRGESLALH